MNGKTEDVRQAAEDYRRQGVAVCRIRAGEKRPTDRGWTTRSADPHEFRPGDNVGLQCGWISDGGQPGRFLVCVDIDDSDAIAKAEEHLPPTGAIEGREGKPRSHRWYYVTGPIPLGAESKAPAAVAAAKAEGREPGPAIRHFTHADSGAGLFDFIGTGGQAVAPPSLHASGEQRRWEEGCDISRAATLPFADLWAAVLNFAAAIGAKLPDEDDAEDVSDSTPTAVAQAGQVQGTCTRNCNVTMEERAWRCERYLQAVDLARSGRRGHNGTFRVGKLIVNDFAVTDRDTAMRLLRGYNERLKEVGDGWTEHEMAHKIDDAIKALDGPPDPKFPFGGKLDGRTNRGPGAPAWDDPSKLADAFVQRQPVLYFSGRYFVYNGRNYDDIDANTLKAQVWSFIEGEARRYDPEFPPKVTRALRDGVVAAIEARGVGRLNGRSNEVVFNEWLPGTGRSGDTLVVRNGLLDVASGELSPHTPDFLGLYCLPYDYDTAATCPTWEKAVDRICEGDSDLKLLIQQWFGYCLTTSTDQQKFMVLVGEGANGKSTLIGGLLAVIGQANASHVALEKFSGSFDLGYSLGKLVNVPDDMSEIDKANEGVLKTYTSGGAMQFNQKNRPILSARPTAKLMFSTNTVPRFSDRSSGLWRRLLLVPLTVVIPEAKRVKGMDKPGYWDTIGETAGMLNWALTGLEFLRDKGFVIPAKVRDAVDEHQLESNPTRIFLTDHIEPAKGKWLVSQTLYLTYHDWMKTRGHTPLGHIQFTKELRRMIPTVSRESKRVAGAVRKVLKGIQWNEPNYQELIHIED